jgi:hypothetical protein
MMAHEETSLEELANLPSPRSSKANELLFEPVMLTAQDWAYLQENNIFSIFKKPLKSCIKSKNSPIIKHVRFADHIFGEDIVNCTPLYSSCTIGVDFKTYVELIPNKPNGIRKQRKCSFEAVVLNNVNRSAS